MGSPMLTVGAVMRESVQKTLEFVSWYLSQGADQIIICFDDPNDPAIPFVERHNNVHCVRCTPEFWQTVGMTIDRRFQRRQNRAMQHFYDAQTEGWFLHVDGDELVYLAGRSLAQELARTAPDVRAVTFQPAENIQTPGSPDLMHFRLLMSDRAVNAVYSDLADAMSKRNGLSGHTAGKSATRAGIEGAQMRQHFMHWRVEDKNVNITGTTLGTREGAYLLHFFDQGYDAWRAKLPWRLASRGFRGEIMHRLRALLDQPDAEAELRAIYDCCHVFPEKKLSALEDFGALLYLDLGLDTLVRAYFPNLEDIPLQAPRYVA